MKEVLDIPDGTPLAFTDGSALGNPGPCGGAALIYPEGLQGEPGLAILPGSRKGTNYLGELLGLQAALLVISLESIPLPNAFHIFIDCTAAMNSAAGVCEPSANFELVKDTEELISFLEEGGCRVHLHWTPSHINVSLNDIVDIGAKIANKSSSKLHGLLITPGLG